MGAAAGTNFAMDYGNVDYNMGDYEKADPSPNPAVAEKAAPGPRGTDGLGGNPKWEKAEEVRQEGYERHQQAQDHFDNAAGAAAGCRAFEAQREARQAATDLYAATQDYDEANRLENEAAQETIQESNNGCAIC